MSVQRELASARAQLDDEQKRRAQLAIDYRELVELKGKIVALCNRQATELSGLRAEIAANEQTFVTTQERCRQLEALLARCPLLFTSTANVSELAWIKKAKGLLGV